MIPQTFHGKALIHSWEYAKDGRPLAIIARYEDDTGKEVIPYRPNGKGWKLGALPEPRPLYGLDSLKPDRVALITEGEKCASALHSMGYCAVTSSGGSKAADKSDWTPLSGCKQVYLLPDNDSPGAEYAQAVAACLAALDEPPEGFLVELPDLPEKGDVVNWLEARLPGWNGYDPVPESVDIKTEFLRTVKENARPLSGVPPIEWPAIIPLSERGDIGESAPYRADLLPPAVRKATEEVARFNMVPEVSPAIVALAVLATAIGKKAIVVERPGHEHYPALFFALIAASGERKSPVFRLLTRAFEAWAEAQKEGYEIQLRNTKARNAAVDNQISITKAQAKKERLTLEAVTDDIAALEAERLQPPPFPSLFSGDITEQRLFQKMRERGGEYSVMSGEARQVFDAIMGRYSKDGMTGDSTYLAGISGDTITRDRVGGDAGPEEGVIFRPCLNVCAMVQPDKFMEVASHGSLRASGALARIWPVWLPSLVGTRFEREDDKGLNTSLLKPFDDMVTAILAHETQADEHGRLLPHKASLSAEAQKARREFHNAVESMMAEGGDLEDVADIASKAVSQACKLALILHIAQDHEVLNESASIISARTWAIAQELGTYHLTEAARVQRISSEDPTLEAARRVLRWIQRERLSELTVRTAQQFGPRPRLKAEQLPPVLELLEDHGYLRAEREPGKKKPVYRISPGYVATVASVAGGNGEK